MRIIKTTSKKTHLNKNGKEVHNTIYFLENDDNKRVLIKPVYVDDYKILDYLAVFVKREDLKF